MLRNSQEEIIYNLAVKKLNSGQLDEGFELLHPLPAKIDKNSTLYIKVILSLANYFTISEKHKIAKQYLVQIENHPGLITVPKTHAYYLYSHAVTARYMGETAEAIHFLKQALIFYKSTNNQLRCTAVHSNISELYLDQQKLKESKEHIDLAIESFQKIEGIDEELIVDLRIALFRIQGKIEFYIGNPEIAIESINTSIKLAEKLNSAYHVTYSKLYKAEFLIKQFPEKTYAILEETTAYIKSTESDKSLVVMHTALNIIYYHIVGDPKKVRAKRFQLNEYLDKLGLDNPNLSHHLEYLEKRILERAC